MSLPINKAGQLSSNVKRLAAAAPQAPAASVSRYASIKQTPEASLRKRTLASAIASQGFKRIANDVYEQTSGEDLGSIWVVADVDGEKWLVAYEDDYQRIVRSVKNASVRGMKKTAAVDDLEYIKGILRLNPIEKVFPVTHKSNQGISLDVWEKALTDLGIPYKREGYTHHRSDGNSFESEMLVQGSTKVASSSDPETFLRNPNDLGAAVRALEKRKQDPNDESLEALLIDPYDVGAFIRAFELSKHEASTRLSWKEKTVEKVTDPDGNVTKTVTVRTISDEDKKKAEQDAAPEATEVIEKTAAAVVVPFAEVRIGDLGEDYNGDPVTIIAKGVGSAGWLKLRGYDVSGAMQEGIDDGLLPDDFEGQQMVAVSSDGDPDPAVYTYGEDGVVVRRASKTAAAPLECPNCGSQDIGGAGWSKNQYPIPMRCKECGFKGMKEDFEWEASRHTATKHAHFVTFKFNEPTIYDGIKQLHSMTGNVLAVDSEKLIITSPEYAPEIKSDLDSNSRGISEYTEARYGSKGVTIARMSWDEFFTKGKDDDAVLQYIVEHCPNTEMVEQAKMLLPENKGAQPMRASASGEYKDVHAAEIMALEIWHNTSNRWSAIEAEIRKTYPSLTDEQMVEVKEAINYEIEQDNMRINSSVRQAAASRTQLLRKLQEAGFNPDRLIVGRDGTITFKVSYFYRHGQSARKYADALQTAFPEIEIVDATDEWKAWPTESYFVVKFRFPSEQPDVDALSADEGFVDRAPHANETPESLMLQGQPPVEASVKTASYKEIWRNDRFKIYEYRGFGNRTEYELIRTSDASTLGQYATLAGAKLEAEELSGKIKTANIDPEELALGTEVEMEHKDTIKKVMDETEMGVPEEEVVEEAAKDTAGDHIDNTEHYYTEPETAAKDIAEEVKRIKEQQ